MFRRRAKGEDAGNQLDELADADSNEFEDASEAEGGVTEGRVGLPPAPRPEGPFDISEVDEAKDGRVDLGGLLVPGVDGMELRVEVAGDAIVAATLVLGNSAIQLQAFAAPKSEGIWGEVRQEIADGIEQQGGAVDEEETELGWGLRARVPVQLPDGTQGVQLVRFVGCDGPRWFLRGVISGQAAMQDDAAAVLEQVFRQTIVVRGEGPMAPRDPIVLRLPEDAQMVADGMPQQQGPASASDLNPFERGPEITEVR
ncbi:DUF3710 domain-containing protein [Streptacidiphilus pinicola]|uniref:DUF3710 domain-containing protein n=1 Tax=Streptacidiphilus pinicola TaxID=2219663 RepID=UPI00140280A3|nr:DUF3710 domain-containing protein [Streptacidiphilus pinicola]